MLFLFDSLQNTMKISDQWWFNCLINWCKLSHGGLLHARLRTVLAQLFRLWTSKENTESNSITNASKVSERNAWLKWVWICFNRFLSSVYASEGGVPCSPRRRRKRPRQGRGDWREKCSFTGNALRKWRKSIGSVLRRRPRNNANMTLSLWR